MTVAMSPVAAAGMVGKMSPVAAAGMAGVMSAVAAAGMMGMMSQSQAREARRKDGQMQSASLPAWRAPAVSQRPALWQAAMATL